MNARTRIDGEVIDSRDLIEVMEELEADDPAALDADEVELLVAIRELSEEGIEDWQYGAGFIREDYFEEYAQELAEDIGAISPDAAWPLSYIDWKAAAEALQQDYSEVSFLGRTYYVRG